MLGNLTITAITLFGCAELDDTEQSDSASLISDGAQLFHKGTFGGNGTTCTTCHLKDEADGGSGTLNPAQIEALFQSDPNNVLFQHDRADVIGGNTFDRFREHATVLINKGLPPNVRLVGSDARSVILARGIPTTMNTPALDPVLMYDGRDPDLQTQAQGAVHGHAQGADVSDYELDAIAAWQRTLFNRDDLEQFFKKGKAPTLPYGTTDAEIRGRRFFIADNSDNPDDVGESPASKCGWCHSGPMLNGTSAFFSQNIAPIPASEGLRFITALVSEINPLGLPVQDYEFTLPDGSTAVVSSPDPGVALVGVPGLPFGGIHPNFVGFFKIPTLWGTRDTAPYFHDNSAKTIEELMDHYDLALFLLSTNNPRNPPIIDLTEQEKADIAAYLRLL
jgi:cytochrome c peroxidase